MKKQIKLSILFHIVLRFMGVFGIYLIGTWSIADWISNNIGDYYTSGAFYGLITFVFCMCLFPFKSSAEIIDKKIKKH